MSPLHLLMPIFEATAEFRVADKIGLAVIGGGGQARVKDPTGETWTFNAYEVGGQFVAYPISNFDKGLQVGAEALYVAIDLKNYPGEYKAGLGGAASGLAVGPFVGYKVGTDVGFVFVVQGGFAYMTAKAKAKNTSSGESVSDSQSDFLPMVNLNVGWSF